MGLGTVSLVEHYCCACNVRWRRVERRTGPADRRTFKRRDRRETRTPNWLRSEFISREPWHLAISRRTPMLLVGSSAATRDVLTQIDPWLIAPVVHVGCRSTMELPNAEPVGTVVLYDVHWLGERAQRQLLEWLDKHRQKTLVISTSACRLTPLIRTNHFLETLYYRLNIFYVEVEAISS